MFQIIGIVMLFAMVFGSFLLHGGKMATILYSLPYELMAIFGAGIAMSENGSSMRRGLGILFGLSIAFAASSFFLSFFSFSGGAVV